MRHTPSPWAVLAILLAYFPCAGLRADDAPAGFHPELVAAELTATQVRPGDPISFTLKFRNNGTEPGKSTYRVFTHFESPKPSCENIVIHADHAPTDPVTHWGPGQSIVDGPHSFTVPAEAADGEYFMHVGLFDHGGTGRRLSDSYAKTTIRVSKSAAAVDTLSPTPLSRTELARRVRAITERFSPTDKRQLNTLGWSEVAAAAHRAQPQVRSTKKTEAPPGRACG